MTPLAPLVTAFFRKHLATEKGVSKNTIVSYSYTFKFLCRYVSTRLGKAPSALCLEDLDSADHPGLSGRSGTRVWQHAADQKLTADCYPIVHEVRRVRCASRSRSDPSSAGAVEQADPGTPSEPSEQGGNEDGPRCSRSWYAQRGAATKLCSILASPLDCVSHSSWVFVSTRLNSMARIPSILVRGKARRQRRLPLWKEATRALRAWLALRSVTSPPTPEVFLNARGEALTPSGFRYVVKKLRPNSKARNVRAYRRSTSVLMS